MWAEFKRALSRIGLILVGAIEMVVGVGVFIGTGAALDAVVHWRGQEISAWDYRMVVAVQGIAALGFLVQGSVTICAGVLLTIRAVRDDLER